MPYHLVPHKVSDDTVQALQELLEDAQQGKLIGIAFGAMYRRKRAFVDTAGECNRSPIFTSGMVEQLQNYVSSRTHLSDSK